MVPIRGYYSLIQYCPDASRAEGANVGVVLYCPDAPYIGVRMSGSNDRVRRFFRGATIDLERLNAAKKAFANRLRSAGQDFRSPEDLDAFMRSRGNELVLVPLRPMKVREHPEQELATLYRELVGGRAARRPHEHFANLERFFRKPGLEYRIKFNQVIEIPEIERPIKIPYVYKNGAEHLVLPRLFHRDKDVAANAAMTLVVEGGLLEMHSPHRRLIVVAQFEGDARIPSMVSGLFRVYKRRLITPPELPAFEQEVESQAHE